jgi:hypothetical protein
MLATLFDGGFQFGDLKLSYVETLGYQTTPEQDPGNVNVTLIKHRLRVRGTITAGLPPARSGETPGLTVRRLAKEILRSRRYVRYQPAGLPILEVGNKQFPTDPAKNQDLANGPICTEFTVESVSEMGITVVVAVETTTHPCTTDGLPTPANQRPVLSHHRMQGMKFDRAGFATLTTTGTVLVRGDRDRWGMNAILRDAGIEGPPPGFVQDGFEVAWDASGTVMTYVMTCKEYAVTPHQELAEVYDELDFNTTPGAAAMTGLATVKVVGKKDMPADRVFSLGQAILFDMVNRYSKPEKNEYGQPASTVPMFYYNVHINRMKNEYDFQCKFAVDFDRVSIGAGDRKVGQNTKKGVFAGFNPKALANPIPLGSAVARGRGSKEAGPERYIFGKWDPTSKQYEFRSLPRFADQGERNVGEVTGPDVPTTLRRSGLQEPCLPRPIGPGDVKFPDDGEIKGPPDGPTEPPTNPGGSGGGSGGAGGSIDLGGLDINLLNELLLAGNARALLEVFGQDRFMGIQRPKPLFTATLTGEVQSAVRLLMPDRLARLLLDGATLTPEHEQAVSTLLTAAIPNYYRQPSKPDVSHPYQVYMIECRWDVTTGKMVVPTCSDGPDPDNPWPHDIQTCSRPTATLEVKWTAERIGEPPQILNPEPRDPNYLLVKYSFVPECITASVGGQIRFIRSGWAKYEVINPQKMRMFDPVPPFMLPTIKELYPQGLGTDLPSQTSEPIWWPALHATAVGVASALSPAYREPTHDTSAFPDWNPSQD